MRVLALHSHPVSRAIGNAHSRQTLESLKTAGHEVDDVQSLRGELRSCALPPRPNDLPRLSRNTELVKEYVDRLKRAEAPGDRHAGLELRLPGNLEGLFRPRLATRRFLRARQRQGESRLRHIRKLGAVLTYGATPFRAFVAGNPPEKDRQAGAVRCADQSGATGDLSGALRHEQLHPGARPPFSQGEGDNGAVLDTTNPRMHCVSRSNRLWLRLPRLSTRNSGRQTRRRQ